MFLDSTTAILVIAPIIAKPLVAAGVDPVHLGMVVVFNLMIGLLTPPMGLALFLVADIAKVTMKDVLQGDAALLRSAGDHAAAHHVLPGDHDLASALGASLRRSIWKSPSLPLRSATPPASAPS